MKERINNAGEEIKHKLLTGDVQNHYFISDTELILTLSADTPNVSSGVYLN